MATSITVIQNMDIRGDCHTQYHLGLGLQYAIPVKLTGPTSDSHLLSRETRRIRTEVPLINSVIVHPQIYGQSKSIKRPQAKT